MFDELPHPPPPPTQEEFHVVCLSGGAWRGAIHYWVLVYLMSNYYIQLIAGVSVGSINGIAAATGQLDKLLEFWSSVNGLGAYLRFRVAYLLLYISGITHLYEWATGRPWMGGVYSMEGLRATIKQDAQLEKICIPFIAGVVSLNSGKYYNVDSRHLASDEDLHTACIASSCMAPFMTPPLIDLGETDPSGKRVKSVGFDGGGKNIFPVPHEAIQAARAAGKRVVVHAVGCMPLERIQWKDTTQVSGMLELALRGLEVLEDEIYSDDLMGDLCKAVGPEGEVRVWLPTEHPGGSFDADPDTIQRRLNISKAMVEAGPTFVLYGY